jgi:hypothetical protein
MAVRPRRIDISFGSLFQHLPQPYDEGNSWCLHLVFTAAGLPLLLAFSSGAISLAA